MTRQVFYSSKSSYSSKRDGQTTMTVTVPQDSNKRKVQSHEEAPRCKGAGRGGRGRANKKQSEWGRAPPPTICASQGTTMPICEEVEVYNEQSLCAQYHSQGVQTLFYKTTFLLKTPWEIRSLQGPQKIQGMREQISLMLQKKAITEVPPNTPGFLFQRFPGTESVRRVAPSNRLKSKLTLTFTHLTFICAL